MPDLIAKFTAQPGHAAVVDELIGGYARTVRAEPGNLRFDVFTDHDDDHAFVVIEAYRDDQAFKDHMDGAAGAAFNAELVKHITTPTSDLQFLRPAGA